MNLYPRKSTLDLDLQVFRHPPAEYRGAPFWVWNNKLDQAQLLRQIESFKQMGMSGRFLFFCNTDREQGREDTQICIKGEWKVTVLETLTGETMQLTSHRPDVRYEVDRLERQGECATSFAPSGTGPVALAPGARRLDGGSAGSPYQSGRPD